MAARPGVGGPAGGQWAGGAGVGAPLRIATRASALARWQAAHVADMLGRLGHETELVALRTAGDERSEVPIAALGATGAFVKEVQLAVLDGRADLAVHSAKDLPSGATPGLVIAAVPLRADPRDALVGALLADLAPGAVVATGSPRRRAQLAWARPDLAFVELRGSIETRLGRVPAGGAAVVAAAALDRLGLAGRAAQILDPDLMLPQVGQGALAVECRADDEELRAVLAGLDDAGSHRALEAERAFLCKIGPGCALPIAAHSPPSAPAAGAAAGSAASAPGSAAAPLRLDALLASFDGKVVLRRSGVGTDPTELGERLAAELVESPQGALLVEAYRR
ncbi:MAG: hydroxymethylbilane synthase [Acidimicrobiales bacterium]